MTDREIQQAAAEEAPWEEDEFTVWKADGDALTGYGIGGRPIIPNGEERRFIAHFNPERVGLLLDVLQAARDERDEGLASIGLESALDSYDALKEHGDA